MRARRLTTKKKKKQRRLVRRESLWVRLRGLPGDLALAASEQIETIDWAELRWSVLVPAGLAANVILLLCRVAVDRARARGVDLASTAAGGSSGSRVMAIVFGPAVLLTRMAAWLWTQFIGRATLEQGGLYSGADGGDDDIFAAPRAENQNSGSGTKLVLLYVLPLVVGWLLVFVSIGNTVSCLFLRRRKYYLAERPLDHNIDSASAQIEPMLTVPIPADADSNDDDDGNDNNATSGKGLLVWLFSWRQQPKLAPSVAELDSGRQQLVWTLDTWDPSIVNLHLLAFFSPLNVLLLWFGPLSGFNVAVVVPLLTLLLAYVILAKFSTKLTDLAVLHAEVLREYEVSVVRPLSSVARRDVAVGCDGSVSFYAPSLNHQFRPRHQPYSTTTTAVPLQLPHEVLGAPVFPSTLAAANAVRQRESLPPFKLTYNSAGYYTGSPKIVEPTTSHYTSSHGVGHDDGGPAHEGSLRREPASFATYTRPTDSSLFRRLHR
ncbi:hypothetical protein D0Z00_004425 [Geotrichum galactomycetum]|uniref:Uncharacterized protein n=1 Tax=Geotrichum galactomycetum TaxID=27317 RepID=A0ACB6UYG7_9ASCO|nr:hypothetical protein D0Z00_004425 [Geotrichum candidum]